MTDPRVEKLKRNANQEISLAEAAHQIRVFESTGLIVIDPDTIAKEFEAKNDEELTYRDRPNNGSIHSTKNAAHHDGFAYGVRWALSQILGEGR